MRPSGRSWFFIGTLKNVVLPKKDEAKAKAKAKKASKDDPASTAPGAVKKPSSKAKDQSSDEPEIGSLRFELGLGSAQDVSLAKARERAAEIRAMLVDGIDPRVARAAAKVIKKPKPTFGQFAMDLVDDIEDDFKNPKHRQQWRNTLKTYAEPLFALPVDAVTTEAVLGVLQPIWSSKPETASRLRGRIERTLDAVKVKLAPGMDRIRLFQFVLSVEAEATLFSDEQAA